MTERLLHCPLERSAARLPNKEALKHGEQSLSYAAFLARARAAAAALARVPGTDRGDRVGIFMGKSLSQAVWLYAASMADRAFVLLADQLKDNQVEHILKDCGVKVLVYGERCAQAAARAAGLLGITLLAEDAAADPATLAPSRAITDDIATIIYTSGSTGLPKGIVITHRNLLDGVDAVSEYLGIGEGDRLMGLLPFNFDYGLNQLSSAVGAGASLVLHQFFVPGPMLKLIAEERITGLAAIPTVWAAAFNPKLANMDKLKAELDFSSLRYITNSGGKIPVPIVGRIRESFPKARLFLMYGLTEAFRSSYLDPAELDRRPDSMGKAIPGVQLEVVRDDGTLCAPGETGELIHRGALIARGYWNNPEKTAEVYRPNPLLPPENCFLETVVYSGDLVRKDEEGFLYYVGRKDNMIKISGYRVSPTEVEELLASSGLVAESVAFGVPDDELGYRIRAAVVYKGEENAQALLEHCKKAAPSYLVPRDLISVKAFPKTASGKIDRPAVLKEHGEHA
jgi:acyl-CoA ligase (AMP-forming) (exosortase A-associated)